MFEARFKVWSRQVRGRNIRSGTQYKEVDVQLALQFGKWVKLSPGAENKADWSEMAGLHR